MAKRATKTSRHNATDGKSAGKPARFPEGYGALRGQFVIREGLDVTRPIFEQVLKLDRNKRRQPRR
jgi:hypothetical protein